MDTLQSSYFINPKVIMALREGNLLAEPDHGFPELFWGKKRVASFLEENFLEESINLFQCKGTKRHFQMLRGKRDKKQHLRKD